LFDTIVGSFRQRLSGSDDKRTGKNTCYGMKDALLVNWCEVTVSRPDGQVTYHNAFVTSHPVTDDTMSKIELQNPHFFCYL
jgi:hypothetical protein